MDEDKWHGQTLSRKERQNGKVRSIYRCQGHPNGTQCVNTAKTSGEKCRSCVSGRSSSKEYASIKLGEIKMCSDGVRRGRSPDGQLKQMCMGDNDTCKSYRRDADGLCDGHMNDNKKYGTAGLIKGEIVERNGEKKVFDGEQLRIFCKFPECCQIVTKEGYCKKHSPHWHCKFTGFQCTSIRIDCTDYCTIHQDNIAREKTKSKGEKLITEYLTKLGVKFETNKHQSYNGNTLYPDFYLPEYNVVIEFDGEQHFKAVDYWGGDEGLEKRQKSDELKNEWARQEMKAMLRISYLDINSIEDIIDAFLIEMENVEHPNNILLSPFHAGIGCIRMTWLI